MTKRLEIEVENIKLEFVRGGGVRGSKINKTIHIK